MNTARNKWLTLAFGLVLAGGTLVWPPGSQAQEPPKAPGEQGRLQGRFTAADTGQPVAGAKLRVLIEGVPGMPKLTEAVSGPDGRYKLDVPLGHISIWGVHAPAGYYTQDPVTFGPTITTAAKPAAERDFVLQPGSAWRVEVQGVTAPEDKRPQFSAYPNADPRNESFARGEIIYVACDAAGKAVLTIPAASSRYRFNCEVWHSPGSYEIPAATLKIDKDFDPRKIKGVPEPVPEVRGAVLLRDAAGRTAVVEGVDVLVEAGQAVLRFPAQKVPAEEALVLRGAVADQAGKPIVGARCTAAFFQANPVRGPSAGSGYVTHLEATTDAQGKFELRDVLLPQSLFHPDSRIHMLVVRSGFRGVETDKLSPLDFKQVGSGDFGTVVLKTGHTLRGKVVDDSGRPLQGALVTNRTNYFLDSHLACRTDAKGQFVMPDLTFGTQQLAAVYGEQSGGNSVDFDATNKECIITVHPNPKRGKAAPPPAR